MDRKRRILVILTVLVLAAAGIVLLCHTMDPGGAALRFYRRSRPALEENLQAHSEHGEALYAPDAVNVTEYRQDGHTVVEYMVTGRGLAPSSRYYGIFYSKDDVPVCFQGVEMPLVQVSDGEWEWHEKQGDNHGSIRKLEPHWYYFEAAF